MTTKCKPPGPRFKKFEIWTKMAKQPKPRGPKWQFTLVIITLYIIFSFNIFFFLYHICFFSFTFF
ncbi:hypothetical protein Hanom_Chr17g01580161 [Helianthus anomalus]